MNDHFYLDWEYWLELDNIWHSWGAGLGEEECGGQEIQVRRAYLGRGIRPWTGGNLEVIKWSSDIISLPTDILLKGGEQEGSSQINFGTLVNQTIWVREAFIKKKCNICYTCVWTPPPYFPESVRKNQKPQKNKSFKRQY